MHVVIPRMLPGHGCLCILDIAPSLIFVTGLSYFTAVML
jgi:hypothetical protein